MKTILLATLYQIFFWIHGDSNTYVMESCGVEPTFKDFEYIYIENYDTLFLDNVSSFCYIDTLECLEL